MQTFHQRPSRSFIQRIHQFPHHPAEVTKLTWIQQNPSHTTCGCGVHQIGPPYNAPNPTATRPTPKQFNNLSIRTVVFGQCNNGGCPDADSRRAYRAVLMPIAEEPIGLS
ncbi:hypothetical protein EVAR_43855_1 [Eumeta japonica]|uniref:Uncharacterized protein n=1 Tax=Eumeta variegata TaxID=151549 RepID=A0A4C1WXJ9_EUMVA|nr:hypothetical protein EVAR_43855_1 [Eumeta japonica]